MPYHGCPVVCRRPAPPLSPDLGGRDSLPGSQDSVPGGESRPLLPKGPKDPRGPKGPKVPKGPTGPSAANGLPLRRNTQSSSPCYVPPMRPRCPGPLCRYHRIIRSEGNPQCKIHLPWNLKVARSIVPPLGPLRGPMLGRFFFGEGTNPQRQRCRRLYRATISTIFRMKHPGQDPCLLPL